MEVPLEIAFRGIDKSDSIEELIRQKVDKLNKVCGYLNSCRVTVEQPQKHQDQGNPYRVRIDMTIPPGHELVARQDPNDSDMHDPLETVIRRAFDIAKRQLLKLKEKQRGEVKSHPQQEVIAIVARIFPEEGYGFLQSVEDDREVYFHRNSVINGDFARMKKGIGVHYVAEEGDEGLQATTVHILDVPRV